MSTHDDFRSADQGQQRKDIIREFETGATRDSEEGKFDYEGFFSPLVLERYAAYMHKHRKQSDGTIRDSDNWQKGMPLKVYVKSLVRHVIDLWKLWRGYPVADIRTGLPVDIEDSACAIIFNVMGFLQVRLRGALPITVSKPANPEKWPSHRPVAEERTILGALVFNPHIYEQLKKTVGVDGAERYKSYFDTPAPKGWHNRTEECGCHTKGDLGYHTCGEVKESAKKPGGN